MQLTITIPDAIAPKVVGNICAATEYDAASGKTKAQWAKEQVISQLKAMNRTGAMMIARDAEDAATTAIG